MNSCRYRIFRNLDDLPPDYSRLIDCEKTGSIFHSREWFESMIDFGIDSGDLHIIGVGDPAAKALMIIGVNRHKIFRNLVAQGLDSSQSFLPSLVISLEVKNQRPIYQALAEGLRVLAVSRLYLDLVRDDVFDLDALVSGLRDANFIVHTNVHEINRFEDVSDASVSSFSSKGTRRKETKIRRAHDLQFNMITTVGDLDQAWSDYCEIWQNSWKDPDVAVEFVRSLIYKAAQRGWLRMLTMYVDKKPVAVEVVFVYAGVASSFKAAFDEAYRQYSVGSINLQHMMRYLVEDDGVVEIDFGPGDEPYKRRSMSRTRKLWSTVAFDQSTVSGHAAHVVERTVAAAKRLRRLFIQSHRGQVTDRS